MAAYNFGGGCPDPGSVPTEGLAAAAQRVIPLLHEGIARYPEALGHRPLREVAAARFERREGVALNPDEICLANGSQQPITLFCQALLGPGVPVLCEEFTYPGTLRAMRHVGAEVRGIPMDDDGMRMDALAAELARLDAAGTPPGFIYTTPTYQNPTGSSMSVARRKEMLALAERYRVPIVDDNCYGDLDFDGPPLPAIKALAYTTNDQRPTTNDPRRAEVILFESFSKIVGPGIRLGYFACARERIDQVLGHKIDGGTSTLAAAILAEYLKEHLAEHIATITPIVREKRNAIVSALDRHLGDLCEWTHPAGGYFIWIRVPDRCDVARLDELAQDAGIIYGPGWAFHYANERAPYFRLSFAYPSLEEIEEGVAAMARCVRAAMPQATRVAV
jgi:2-aminoadipate transaminase